MVPAEQRSDSISVKEKALQLKQAAAQQQSQETDVPGLKPNMTEYRRDFPILEQCTDSGRRIVYLDTAATSLRPVQVVQAMEEYYQRYNANIHRGIYRYAEQATAAYEGARSKTAAFLNAPSDKCVVFTRNTTESINLVAFSYARAFLQEGDVILVSEMEHHANMVPWQVAAREIGLRLEYIPFSEEGHLDLEAYHELLDLKPKLLALTHMSNVLGTINPLQDLIGDAHTAGALVLVDAAQSAAHFPLDVQALNIDFAAFSAHKMLGPTGIGVLYARRELLEKMPPFLTGGDMIREVHLDGFTTNDVPHKFEAGTPAIAEAIGLAAAIDYLDRVGKDNIHDHETALTARAMRLADETPGMHVLGPPLNERGGLLSFTLDGIHPHDIAQVLDREGVAVRAGHHCAMPVHEHLGIPATARASFYLYNTMEDVDRLFESIHAVQGIFN